MDTILELLITAGRFLAGIWPVMIVVVLFGIFKRRDGFKTMLRTSIKSLVVTWVLFAILRAVFNYLDMEIFQLLPEPADTRLFLFLFPNLFENWWLYCVVVLKWFPSLVPHSWKGTVIPLVLLLIPKMGQEYLLHVTEAKPWNWTKENILDPVGLRP